MKTFVLLCSIAVMLVFGSCGSGRIYYAEKPPDPISTRPVSTNPNLIWIGPGYTKKGGKYIHREGYWTSLPNNRHHWVEGRWKQHKKGWYWVNGHWR